MFYRISFFISLATSYVCCLPLFHFQFLFENFSSYSLVLLALDTHVHGWLSQSLMSLLKGVLADLNFTLPRMGDVGELILLWEVHFSGRTAGLTSGFQPRWQVFTLPFAVLSFFNTNAHSSAFCFCIFCLLSQQILSVCLQERGCSSWGFSLHRHAGTWPFWEGSVEVLSLWRAVGLLLWRWASASESE